MTETTWTHSMSAAGRSASASSRVRLWAAHLVAPLHRALDAALRADELRALNGATLADIGLHRQ